MNQSSIFRFLKRNQSQNDEEQIASGSGSGSINCKRSRERIENDSIFYTNNEDEASKLLTAKEIGIIDLSNLPTDLGERRLISEYCPRQQDEIRRHYAAIGPIQPVTHDFPSKYIEGRMRKFTTSWFRKFKNWLEHSIKKDAAFCLYCYLFANVRDNQCGDFIISGFSTWNKAGDSFKAHVGNFNSTHSNALKAYERLWIPDKTIEVAFDRHDAGARKEYRIRFDTSISCSRYLLRQGLPFCGHDESESSENRGNFLELVKFAASLSKLVADVVLDNAPQKNILVAPSIQKDIVNVGVKETLITTMDEFKGDVFGLLMDESGDVSHKEQMAIVFRYVDKMGVLKERFVGIVHVVDTSALSLKAGIDSLLSEHSLSLSMVRAQGYDGASNMQGKFKGLKTLIMNENESSYSIHCFSHQLQLTLVALARDHDDVGKLFDSIIHILNVVGASTKRYDMLRDQQKKRIKEALSNGEIKSGQGLNQELGPIKACDTCWGTHYKSLMNVIALFSPIIDVLSFIDVEGDTSTIRNEARSLMAYLRSFDCIFSMHLMLTILGMTHDLSQALQKKDQNKVNAINLVKTTKRMLQMTRDDGWDPLMDKVSAFCKKHEIFVPNMDEIFVVPGRPRRNAPQITYLHHFQVEIFYNVIDLHLQYLNSRFNEVNTELLLCVAALNPCDGFSAFDQDKLVKLAQLYPHDFFEFDVMTLEHQLSNCILDVQSQEEFEDLKGLGDLCRVMVETKRDST